MGKGRKPCCDKASVTKGPWSQAEDFKLMSFIQNHGHSNWRALPKLAGLARCGKSCRLRWVNYLQPDLKRGNFTPREEEAIIELHETLGNKWSKIASHFPGRTDNEIKNVWNTHLKKRLKNKGCKNDRPILSSSSSSCNGSSTLTCTSDSHGVVDARCGLVLEPQTITSNDTCMEYSSSSCPSYNSQAEASFSDLQLIEQVGDHKDETSECMDKNTLDELLEIHFEPNFDLWDLLHGDSDAQFKDVDNPIPEKHNNNDNIEQRDGNCWWLAYLENELGLDHHHESTPSQSTQYFNP